jgi:hypothetical protein
VPVTGKACQTKSVFSSSTGIMMAHAFVFPQSDCLMLGVITLDQKCVFVD